MITKTLVYALPAVLLLSAGFRVTAQEKPSPPDRVKPVPAIPVTPVAPAAVPAVPVPIKSPKRTGVATIDDADFVTTVPEPGVVPSTTKRSTNSRLIITKERDDIPPLVIQFSDKSDGHDSLAEDLTILTVRVRKAMERSAEEDGITRSTARIGRGTGGSSVRSMYVDGFGPVVFVKVNFPLLAPKEGEQKDPGPAADSGWNKAKQELLAEKHVATVEPVASQPYDAAQVETLK